MNYIDQLNTDNWKSKRSSILARDSNKCQICHNKSYLENSSVAIICGIDNNSYKKPTTINFQDFVTLETSYIEVYNNQNILEQGMFITYLQHKQKYYLTSVLDLKVKFNVSYFGDLDSDKPFLLFQKADYSIEKLHSNLDDLKWRFVSNLHIHHNYYQVNTMAWEYPNSALQTLCWLCHENLHKNTEIDVLDENGDIIGRRKVCPRCYGAGWFPEYSHVEQGVCFKCNGERYI